MAPTPGAPGLLTGAPVSREEEWPGAPSRRGLGGSVAAANTSGRVNERCERTECNFVYISRENICVCLVNYGFFGLCVLVEASLSVWGLLVISKINLRAVTRAHGGGHV